MTTPKQLPARPSLESLRKQAKKLTRDVAAGNSDAIARMRALTCLAQSHRCRSVMRSWSSRESWAFPVGRISSRKYRSASEKGSSGRQPGPSARSTTTTSRC